MEELKDELELIKRMQLAGDELSVVGRCESLNEMTRLSRVVTFIGRSTWIFVLVLLCGSWVSSRFSEPKWLALQMGLLVLVIFCQMYYYWVIIKKLSLRIKHLEQKLDKARGALK